MTTFYVTMRQGWCWEKINPLFDDMGNVQSIADREVSLTVNRGVSDFYNYFLRHPGVEKVVKV